jgi:hypothetical protein
MEYKITKEKILEAASNCNTAKETLKIMFPEAFEEEDSKPAMLYKGGSPSHAFNPILRDLGLESNCIGIANGLVRDSIEKFRNRTIYINNIVYDWGLLDLSSPSHIGLVPFYKEKAPKNMKLLHDINLSKT